MEAFPSRPQDGEGTRRLCTKGREEKKPVRGNRAGAPGPAGATLQNVQTTVHYLTGAFVTERNASCERRGGPPVRDHPPHQSCSRRCFLRRRFRESASFARRFSPGFM